MTTANDYKLSTSTALDLAFYGRCACWTLCMCSHAQALLLFRIKEGLAIYYLRSLCLWPSAGRYLPLQESLCRKASAERHPKASCGLDSVFCLLSSGFRAAAGCLCPDELISVLYRLVINCMGLRQRKTATKKRWLSLA